MPPLKRPRTLQVADIDTRYPPEDTMELRRGLNEFKNQALSLYFNDVPLTKTGKSISVGAVKWGVYAFFDYDGEPIYVGQTRESLGSRIGRHLTNQRTDAVAMSVLDPFEVAKIAVWPLHQYQKVKGDPKKVQAARQAADHLNSLERTVFTDLVSQSAFGKILNEKDPPDVDRCEPPSPIVGDILQPDVRRVRQHPDLRLARRAQTIARLAHIIAGRDVAMGLRRALTTQADRLAWLASERFKSLGGERAVEERGPDEPTEYDVDDEES